MERTEEYKTYSKAALSAFLSPTRPCGGGGREGAASLSPFSFPLLPFSKKQLLSITANQLCLDQQPKIPRNINGRPQGMVFKIEYDFIVPYQWHGQIITLCYLYK